MKSTLILGLIAAVCVTWASAAEAGHQSPSARALTDPPADPCAEFQALALRVYTFKNGNRASDPEEAAQKNRDLNAFWNTVKANKDKYLPCLRAAVANKTSSELMRFDGSNLLVEIDPSKASKQLQVDVYTGIDIDFAIPQRWIETLSYRAFDGLDVSAAAERWMTDPNNHYNHPVHGPVDVSDGLLFLYGAMDEALATPALIRIVRTRGHQFRETALSLLEAQLTPEAEGSLKKLDRSGLSKEVAASIDDMLSAKPLLQTRVKPKHTRTEFLNAFQLLLAGHNDQFFALVESDHDGERDIVTVMRPEDMPTIRKVRRLVATFCTQHAVEFYSDFTRIIQTLNVRFSTTPAAPSKKI